VIGAYLEEQYQDEYAAWTAKMASARDAIAVTTDMGLPVFEAHYHRIRSQAIKDTFDSLGYEESSYQHRIDSSQSFTGDPAVRLKELEADGVVGEFLFANGGIPFQSFGVATDSPRAVELETAGLMAYNRWIADLCQADPGRRFGTALLPRATDVTAVVDVVRWAKDAGLAGIACPNPSGLPPLVDEHYEPIWATAAELEMPVHCHASSWGGKTTFDDFSNTIATLGNVRTRGVLKTECYMLGRRSLWHLIWSGAFDRHPNLKLMFVEQNADWVPNTLKWLDHVWSDGRDGWAMRQFLQHRPSEYWPEHCMVAASMIARGEVALRHEIGVETMGFGTDYPHYEGTWPTTKAWINAAFAGSSVTEPEARAILGENAVRFYGLDHDVLQQAANRCGPSVTDVLEPDPNIDPEQLAWMESRELGRICAGI
jgi:predicted TIM-barrel fold metal-dependent hydrolase